MSEAGITAQDAADILNVSRPYVLKLLDEGTLRIDATSLDRFRVESRDKQRRAAAELTRMQREGQ